MLWAVFIFGLFGVLMQGDRLAIISAIAFSPF
jgi:hypothetical protein